MEYKMTQSGGAAGDTRIDFTIVFNDAPLNEADIASLRENATSLLDSAKITSSIERNVHLFIKNRKTVALVHYEVDAFHMNADDIKLCKKNCEQVIQHLLALIGVYASDRPNAA